MSNPESNVVFVVYVQSREERKGKTHAQKSTTYWLEYIKRRVYNYLGSVSLAVAPAVGGLSP
jgi:hypothetical protein